MRTYTNRPTRLSYRHILESIRVLSPKEQRRLRSELFKMGTVSVAEPVGTPASIRRGKRLAAQIRKRVNAGMSGTLEETMIRLRGRYQKF